MTAPSDTGRTNGLLFRTETRELPDRRRRTAADLDLPAGGRPPHVARQGIVRIHVVQRGLDDRRAAVVEGDPDAVHPLGVVGPAEKDLEEGEAGRVDDDGGIAVGSMVGRPARVVELDPVRVRSHAPDRQKRPPRCDEGDRPFVEPLPFDPVFRMPVHDAHMARVNRLDHQKPSSLKPSIMFVRKPLSFWNSRMTGM